ncbi:toprim domain-containing protein [Candidatus Micrarchaeota archaeon]|nr:toprim domain-containing protein [Candidatus Micrarchaeota archaeon]
MQSVLDKTLQLLEGRVVLVEGKRDKKALEALGVDALVFTPHGPPLRFVEKNATLCGQHGVVLLFDFDADGRRLTDRFTEFLLAYGVVPQALVRNRFERVFGVRTVEDLPARYVELSSKNVR